MAADGGCETDMGQRMNEEYTAWGALKCGVKLRNGFLCEEVLVIEIYV